MDCHPWLFGQPWLHGMTSSSFQPLGEDWSKVIRWAWDGRKSSSLARFEVEKWGNSINPRWMAGCQTRTNQYDLFGHLDLSKQILKTKNKFKLINQPGSAAPCCGRIQPWTSTKALSPAANTAGGDLASKIKPPTSNLYEKNNMDWLVLRNRITLW